MVGVSVVGLSATTAQAASWGPRTIQASGSWKKAGTAQFIAKGDKLRVCDTRKDGHGVRVDVYYKDSDRKPIWRVKAAGKGKCVTKSKNLKEKHTYYFWASDGRGSAHRLATSNAS